MGNGDEIFEAYRTLVPGLLTTEEHKILVNLPHSLLLWGIDPLEQVASPTVADIAGVFSVTSFTTKFESLWMVVI